MGGESIMPGSSKKGKLTITKWFEQIPKKRTILDVGPGWGTYSKLLRKKDQVWHAVEIHKPYISKFQLERYYNKIYLADIRLFQPKIEYDLIILGDILEHLSNKDAVTVLRNLFRKCNWCIISLPLDAETHASTDNSHKFWQNEHEEHKGSWSNKTFMNTIKSLNVEIISMEKYQELGIYLIAARAKKPYIFESIVKPTEWFFFHYTHRYENHENGFLKKYFKKLQNRLLTLF